MPDIVQLSRLTKIVPPEGAVKKGVYSRTIGVESQRAV